VTILIPTTRYNIRIFSTPDQTSMLQTELPRGRGRPKAHHVDQLRTRTWFFGVLHVSGLPSAYAIEMRLDGDLVRKRDVDVARPRKWDGYKKGKKVPYDKPGPRNSITQAEAVFPGTARWFRSPLWSVLRGDEFNQIQIEEALRSLDPVVVSLLFENEPSQYEDQPRLAPFDHGSRRLLTTIADKSPSAAARFDALVAMVLLAKLSEAISSPELRELIAQTFAEIQEPLRKSPVLSEVYPELFPLIRFHCRNWIHVATTQRMEVSFAIEGEALKPNEAFSELHAMLVNWVENP